ncbi:MAG TPA: sigma-54 dependent transcriptional regulator [Candidatus Binatia bacterium]|nr:sigma-54 dependent transcriptional regulator [Candidatus Binatia bacterium]
MNDTVRFRASHPAKKDDFLILKDQGPVLPDLVPSVLVIDDEPMTCKQLERLLAYNGYVVTTAGSAEDGLKKLEKQAIDLVITDLRLPGISGVDLTKRMRELWPDIPVVVMTGYAEIATAVEVLKLGASDYLVKPFSAAAIHESIRNVVEKARVFMEIRRFREQIKGQYELGGMLSKTPEMHRVFEIIRTVADTNSTVVVEGETGTGKELVASAIHHQSRRKEAPFVPINCAGVPESLLESELFGYEQGAFTGANRARPGKIELAQGGTLFLDEIESMPLSMQSKLLLVLQSQKVERLGGSRRIQIDMRVIAASNIPLKDLVAEGRMRSDFYYRINVISIHLIPLRQRLDDIPLLVHDFLHQHPLAKERRIAEISKSAMARLMQFHWPGNIRELHNVLERAIVMTKGHIIEEIELPGTELSRTFNWDDGAPHMSLRRWMQQQEKAYLARKLEAFGGKVGLTAKSCGIDVKSLYRKMRLLGLDKKSYQGRAANDSTTPTGAAREPTRASSQLLDQAGSE